MFIVCRSHPKFLSAPEERNVSCDPRSHTEYLELSRCLIFVWFRIASINFVDRLGLSATSLPENMSLLRSERTRMFCPPGL